MKLATDFYRNQAITQWNSLLLGVKQVLLQKIISLNTQTLQLFTEMIKTEIIYKSNQDALLEGLIDETKLSN